MTFSDESSLFEQSRSPTHLTLDRRLGICLYTTRISLGKSKVKNAEHLQVHDNGFVDFLPQMGSEQLDVTNLQSGDLAVHEDSR